MDNHQKSSTWLFGIAFASLGLLIGNMIGLSADSLVKVLIPAMFAFGGGSVLALLNKLTVNDQRTAAVSLIALSSFCLLGVYIGILQTEYRVFTPKTDGQNQREIITSEQKYLRSVSLERIDIIDTQFRQGLITGETAYEKLLGEVQDDN